MVNIYVDSEMNEALRGLKKRDPSFNLSGFVKNAILTNNQEVGKIDIELVKRNILETIKKKEIIENEVAFWEAKKEKAIQQLVQEEIEKQQREDDRATKDKKEQAKLQLIKDTFQDEMKRPMMDKELMEYSEFGSNIWAYVDKVREKEVRT